MEPYKNLPDGARKIQLPAPPDLPTESKSLGIDNISCILHHTCGVTKKLKSIGGDFLFRAYPSAGALFPLEFYLATRGAPDLDAGIYHYDPRDHSLGMIEGQEAINKLGGLVPESKNASATIFITAVFYRTTIKYDGRGYRYVLMDAGHAAANLAASASMLNLGFSLNMDFPDDVVNEALGLDVNDEACMLICTLGDEAVSIPTNLTQAVDREAPDEHDTTEHFMHKISSMHAQGEAETISGSEVRNVRLPEGFDVLQTIRSRRSMRKYSGEPISAVDFETCRMLTEELARLMPDAPVKTYLLSNSLDSLKPGLWSIEGGEFTPVKEAEMVKDIATACLWQNMAEKASAALIFALDWNRMAELGNRGIRQAYAFAGLVGEGPYIGFKGEDFGACGLGAFFDDLLTETLGLPEGQEAIYMVVFGKIVP